MPKNYPKLAENLQRLLFEKKMKPIDLARELNLPQPTIHRLVTGKSTRPYKSSLMPIAEFFGITMDQLLGDEPLPGFLGKNDNVGNYETILHIPILSWQEAITWPSTNKQTHSTITTEYEYSQNAYALFVEEDGLENLTRGTALLVDPVLKPEHRDFVIVHKSGQIIPTLKQILFDDGQMYLKPLIQGYNITVFTTEHTILGIVLEFKKHLRKRSSETNKIET
jgi:SOS-response transcriptional repressor LexA